MEFNDIHLNMICNPQSGATKVDIMAKMSKRSKSMKSTHNQSSDTRIGGIDLNNDESYEIPTRSMGRNKTKKKSLKVLKAHRLMWRRLGTISKGWTISLMLS
ncbi:unnamed protein product [Lactuca saligna]|uniref:Uncharacterized protein n=1 Tax=Lactuca saligna TaxID=75948 RepID=A0AA35ZGK2_LACSI|nr:unnamed protein product [Lactuca saligna]